MYMYSGPVPYIEKGLRIAAYREGSCRKRYSLAQAHTGTHTCTESEKGLAYRLFDQQIAEGFISYFFNGKSILTYSV